MNSRSTFTTVFFISSIIFLFIVFLLPSTPYIWQGFADPYDYLEQARIPLTQIEFFSPTYYEGAITYQRAFTVPLFYKLVSTEIDSIINLQKLLYVFSIITFVWVGTNLLVKNLHRYFFMFFVLLWALNWNNLGWVNILLSESISTSLFIFWFSTLLLLSKKRTILLYTTHILCLFLLVFTKDSWSMCMFGFYVLLALLSFLLQKKYFKPALIGVGLSFVLLLCNNITATNGARHRTPLANSIVLRIMPNDAYFNWFLDKGMPQGGSLKAKYSNTSENFQNIYPLYTDPELATFRQWIVEKGKGVYIQFLITHPDYFFKFNETTFKSIISEDYHGYIGGPKSISLIITPTSKIISNLLEIIFIILFVLLILTIYKKKDFLSISVLTSMTIAFSFLLITFNGDAVEIERHMNPVHVIIQLSSIFSIFLILNAVSVKKICFNDFTLKP